LLIAGSTQKYAITADATAGSNETICAISPGLVVAHADNAAVTVTQSAKTATNIAFHKNAFALAVAPLSTLGADVGGAQIFTATSPDNTLSIRARIYYVGNSSEVHVALDILYGYKTLDPNLACRAQF